MLVRDSAIHAAVDDHAAANARSQRECHDASITAGRPGKAFAKRGGIGIVFQEHRPLESSAQLSDDVAIDPSRQRVGIVDDAARGADGTGAADAHAAKVAAGPTRVSQQAVSRGDDSADCPIESLLGLGGDDRSRRDRAGEVDGGDGDLRAPNVDADCPPIGIDRVLHVAAPDFWLGAPGGRHRSCGLAALVKNGSAVLRPEPAEA
jgi:hypothetical protein